MAPIAVLSQLKPTNQGKKTVADVICIWVVGDVIDVQRKRCMLNGGCLSVGERCFQLRYAYIGRLQTWQLKWDGGHGFIMKSMLE